MLSQVFLAKMSRYAVASFCTCSHVSLINMNLECQVLACLLLFVEAWTEWIYSLFVQAFIQLGYLSEFQNVHLVGLYWMRDAAMNINGHS